MGPRPAGAYAPYRRLDALRAVECPAGAWTPCGRLGALRARGRPAGPWLLRVKIGLKNREIGRISGTPGSWSEIFGDMSSPREGAHFF